MVYHQLVTGLNFSLGGIKNKNDKIINYNVSGISLQIYVILRNIVKDYKKDITVVVHFIVTVFDIVNVTFAQQLSCVLLTLVVYSKHLL